MAEQPASTTGPAAHLLAWSDGNTVTSGKNGDPFSVATLRAELERGAEAARRCADPTPMMLPKAPAPHAAVVGGLADGVGTHGKSMLQEITKAVDHLQSEIDQLKKHVQALQTGRASNARTLQTHNRFLQANSERLTKIETHLKLSERQRPAEQSSAQSGLQFAHATGANTSERKDGSSSQNSKATYEEYDRHGNPHTPEGYEKLTEMGYR